jgi:hypothetical protein
MRALFVVVVGCGGQDTGDSQGTDTEDSTPLVDPGCADPVYYDATIRGRVTRDGAPAAGAEVRLEERNWAPVTIHGSTLSSPTGDYSIVATQMPIIEGCWGWATGFYVVAEQDGLYADWGVNSPIVSAWTADESTVDLEAIILALE